MRVLVLIPRSNPPVLDGDFSKAFKEFVSLCLQKDPKLVCSLCFESSSDSRSQRPSAKELLKHRFIKVAKKTSYLTELIERHERWQAEHQEVDSDSYDLPISLSIHSRRDDDDSIFDNSQTEEEGWDFGTVKPSNLSSRFHTISLKNSASTGSGGLIGASNQPSGEVWNELG